MQMQQTGHLWDADEYVKPFQGSPSALNMANEDPGRDSWSSECVEVIFSL